MVQFNSLDFLTHWIFQSYIIVNVNCLEVNSNMHTKPREIYHFWRYLTDPLNFSLYIEHFIHIDDEIFHKHSSTSPDFITVYSFSVSFVFVIISYNIENPQFSCSPVYVSMFGSIEIKKFIVRKTRRLPVSKITEEAPSRLNSTQSAVYTFKLII